MQTARLLTGETAFNQIWRHEGQLQDASRRRQMKTLCLGRLSDWDKRPDRVAAASTAPDPAPAAGYGEGSR